MFIYNNAQFHAVIHLPHNFNKENVWSYMVEIPIVIFMPFQK